jgi:predicted ATPase/DNA-binding SARP family transcriptional activator
MLHLLGASPAWRETEVTHALPNTLPGWTIAFLALHGDWVSRERLLTLLWPDAAAAEAQHNLRVDLHRARGVLAGWGQDEALQAERRRVRLTLPTDVEALRRAVGTGAAVSYPGALLASMAFDGFPALQEWAELERAALATTWRDALVARLDQPDVTVVETLKTGQMLLDIDPLDEAATLRMLQALHGQGRAADAQRQYEQYRDRLARELGVDPSPAIRAFAARAGSAAQSHVAAADARAFVGRRMEMTELARRLNHPSSSRLVTIVGPGGIGKSSLARQALSRATMPAHWIDLQDLSQIEAMAARIAQRLDIEWRDSMDAPAQIAHRLGHDPLALVLDNAEHLGGLPEFVARLLDAAPALVVLATSRQPLGIKGEALLPLEGLALPDEDSRDAEAAGAFDAVHLFTLRARAARADFDPERHIEAVIDIVEAVGGLPLAIELAASWVRLLPPEEIARDLLRTLELLERDPAVGGTPARPEHVSVRAVLDRSWDLLAPREREALEALSVFEGGFTRASAAAVTAIALPLISSLVDKGLVAVAEAGRFRLHPLIATDASRRQSEQAGRSAELRDHHAAYWATTLAEVLAGSTSDPRVIVDAVTADYANGQAAWRHAVAARRHDDLHRLTSVWRVFFDTLGRYGEGVQLLSVALGLPAHDTGSERVAAVVRGALSMLQFRRHNLEQAIAVAEAGIAIAERCGERRALVACLFSAGSGHSIQGRWRQSLPMFERALAIAREDNERPEIAVALLNVGICAKKDGRADDALALYSQSLAIERELGRHGPAVRCLNNIGVLHMERGEWALTRDCMAEGLRLCEQYGISSLAPYVETGLGQALYELGAFEDAERHLSHVLATVPAAELPVVHMNVTINLARVALRRKRVDEAWPRFHAAARLALASEAQTDQLDFAMYWGEWLRDSGHAHAAARTWLMVLAHPLTEAGVRQGCDEGLATLRLDTAARAAAQADPLTLDTLKAEWAALPAP